jgi:hypothetical protein
MKLSLLAGTALLALARAVPSNYTVVDVFPALATAPPVPSASPALAVVDNHAPWGNNTALAPSICFRTGPIVDPTNIQPHMQATCKRFVGIYARHENRQACVMDDGGVMWNFALQVRTLLAVDEAATAHGTPGA